MTIEEDRLKQHKEGTAKWKKWGPYVSERQWGTVREDYSANSDAWNYISHDAARSKAYRWGEDAIAGICDNLQLLCFSIALWNQKDPIIKERYFGLTNSEGNHGEDVKELYYYLDSTPSHSYIKMLYKYPQSEFPYALLKDENARRDRNQAEFELMDTGVFDDDKYFDVFVEYAKASPEDMLIKITVHNRGNQDAPLNIIPQLWFKNTWSWGRNEYKPVLCAANNGDILIDHHSLGNLVLHVEDKVHLLFCDNETNDKRLYNTNNNTAFCKDGINQFIIHNDHTAVNYNSGTKAAINYNLLVKTGEPTVIRLRLSTANSHPFIDFEDVFNSRIADADEFYSSLNKGMTNEDHKTIQRQAFAGMLWSKQYYYYNVDEWLKGDPNQPPPAEARRHGRNHEWTHLDNENIISMPDKWEYPWYAAWDLSFHCITLSLLDPYFAKRQLQLLTKEWFMHPNGQLPAYEWSFGDVNPPVHAWATWRVYEIDQKKNNGQGDTAFLESVFHKLLMNFTWWVNRKDAEGNNIFQGGFLGLDNIGVFDRSAQLPAGGYIEQADGTSWMAMYALNMMRIALELSLNNPVYQDLATKFYEHFLRIADAMSSMGDQGSGLWDEDDNFYYDVLKMPGNGHKQLKVRSLVGLIPLFAVEVLDHQLFEKVPAFTRRLKWFLDRRPDLANLVSRWQEKSGGEKHLLSLLRGHRMKKILKRMLDENEFLSEYGVRSLSKTYQDEPYNFELNGSNFSVAYTPAESTTGMFGGNSNWRGPIWMPNNYLIIESLQRFHYYYGDDFKVECPTGSGIYKTLNEVANFLALRIAKLFSLNEHGQRPFNGSCDKLRSDPNFSNHILFYEYFNGDTGQGLGASHQTGWTGLIARLLLSCNQQKEGEAVVQQ